MQATAQATATAEAPRLPQLRARNAAVDTYRGLVMLLMMAEVLQLPAVARAFPGIRSGRSWHTTS